VVIPKREGGLLNVQNIGKVRSSCPAQGDALHSGRKEERSVSTGRNQERGGHARCTTQSEVRKEGKKGGE